MKLPETGPAGKRNGQRSQAVGRGTVGGTLWGENWLGFYGRADSRAGQCRHNSNAPLKQDLK